MISSLRLTHFGKFSDVEYDFSSVTIFIGKNESGKSTLFDAIFDGICSPKGNTAVGKRLRDRYGEDRDSQLTFEGKAYRIDPDEFLNLFAIQAGQVSLDLPAGGNWMDKIKAELFSGGVDPSILIQELDREASTHGNRPHMRELAKRKGEMDRLEGELERLNEARKRILVEEVNLRSNDRELTTIQENLKSLLDEQQDVEHMVKQQNLIKERKDYRSILEGISRLQGWEDRLRSLSRFSTDESGILEAQEQKILETRGRMKQMEKEKQSLVEQQSRLKERHEQFNRRLRDLKRSAELSAELRRHIEAERPIPVIKTKISLRKHWLLSSIITLLLGGAIGVGLSVISVSLFWLPPLICLFLSGFFLIMAVRRETYEDSSQVIRSVDRVKEEWRRRNPNVPEIVSGTYESLIGELAKYETEYDTSLTNSHGQDGELSELDGRINSCLDALSSWESQVKELEKDRDFWLRERGVHDLKEYLKSRSDFQRYERDIQEGQANVEKRQKQYGCENVDSLKGICEARLNQLDQEITEEELSDTRIRQLEVSLPRLRNQVQSYSGKKEQLLTRVSEDRGTIKGSLGDIPDSILSLERRIMGCQEIIKNLNLTRKASALARDLFQKIAEDSSLLLDQLIREIAEIFRSFLGSERTVRMDQFEMTSAVAEDAGGEARAFVDLSTGTQDTFLFAARLALASRSRQNSGIIVLDEPFQAMDSIRTQNLLKLLANFSEERGWQIVLFSKEDTIADLCRRVFKDPVVYKLS